MKVGDMGYRYVDGWFSFDEYGKEGWHISEPQLEHFSVTKLTPCGYWVSRGWGDTHWVNSHAYRKYTYPTEEEAMDSYRIRKYRQVEHCERALARAKVAYEKAGVFEDDGEVDRC